jgi:hypothetical protein
MGLDAPTFAATVAFSMKINNTSAGLKPAIDSTDLAWVVSMYRHLGLD